MMNTDLYTWSDWKEKRVDRYRLWTDVEYCQGTIRPATILGAWQFLAQVIWAITMWNIVRVEGYYQIIFVQIGIQIS